MAGNEEEVSMEMDQDMIINERDGLPNVHPNYDDLPQLGSSDGAPTLEEMVRDEDLPTSLIVTNIDATIFTNEDKKKELELIFSEFGEPTSCQFFRSFRRMRVNYRCPTVAAKSRIHLHQTQIGQTVINCYFAQPVSPIDLQDRHLHPPAPTKQFLISPPASPPVGWAPREEGEPLVNYDLLAAIASLTPGGAHELHPPAGGRPGIVVHVCEETGGNGQRIAQTRCPAHQE